MSAPNSDTNTGDGQDDFESVIIGGDLSVLEKIGKEEEEKDLVGASASTESLVIAKKPNPQNAPVVAAPGQNGEAVPKPAVSRVQDANGNWHNKIILGYWESNRYLSLIIGLIDAASENDIVDITIVTDGTDVGTTNRRSILSAINRCKAHVITRAGALTSVGEVAIWLSGDERHMSPMGCIFLRQPMSGFCGDIADYEARLKAEKESMKEYFDFIADTGLISKSDLNEMCEHRGQIALFGKELMDKIPQLKQLD